MNPLPQIEAPPQIDDPPPAGSASAQVIRWRAGEELPQAPDLVAREEPLEIRVQGRSLSVTMRTPGHDAELAAGFLLGEGLIRAGEDIVEMGYCRHTAAGSEENILNIFLRPGLGIDFERLTRHTFASSSCGLCGKTSIESVRQQFPPVDSNLTVPAAVLLRLPESLRNVQRTFAHTGGLHAAALFRVDGKLLVVREDIGRHNAVDKVIGHTVLERHRPSDRHVLVVSGRASFEIMQKALAARIPIVAAISAPSSLAVEFAQESGQTLVGFLRGNSMNIYAGAERIRG